MSSKRKWDQAAPSEEDSPAKAVKIEDGKTASEAAAAAAAIAAKIAAQFAGQPGGGSVLGPKDPHDGEFVHDIDINDVRNRYLLTKGSTQTQVRQLSVIARTSPQTIVTRCSDTRGDRCFSEHEGDMVSRQVKGDRERPPSVPSHFSHYEGDSAKRC